MEWVLGMETRQNSFVLIGRVIQLGRLVYVCWSLSPRGRENLIQEREGQLQMPLGRWRWGPVLSAGEGTVPPEHREGSQRSGYRGQFGGFGTREKQKFYSHYFYFLSDVKKQTYLLTVRKGHVLASKGNKEKVWNSHWKSNSVSGLGRTAEQHLRSGTLNSMASLKHRDPNVSASGGLLG